MSLLAMSLQANKRVLKEIKDYTANVVAQGIFSKNKLKGHTQTYVKIKGKHI